MLSVQPPDPRVQPSRPRSDKVRSVACDAFRGGHEGFSVAGNRLTLALAIDGLRTSRLSTLRSGVFRLRAWVDRLHAKVAGLRAKRKPLLARVEDFASGSSGVVSEAFVFVSAHSAGYFGIFRQAHEARSHTVGRCGPVGCAGRQPAGLPGRYVHMTQNLVDLDYTPDALAAIDAALAALEAGLAGLLALTPDQRQMLTKMGDKSEAFCRKADAVFGENLAILPANFDLPAYRRDLATMDALRPRLARLSKLSQRGDDTQMAVGSDLMTNALEGYAVLKVTGKGQGVDELRKMLATRFARGPRAPSTPATPTEPVIA